MRIKQERMFIFISNELNELHLFRNHKLLVEVTSIFWAGKKYMKNIKNVSFSHDL